MLNNITTPIRRFFEERLTAERALSRHTVLAYRDALRLFLVFAAAQRRKSCVDLSIEELTPDLVRRFLDHLEKERGNTVRSRNARLAALHAFFRYLATLDPRWMFQSRAVLEIPFKRHATRVLDYLDNEEISHIFRHLNPHGRHGQRDLAVLRMLYNTGARAGELVSLDINQVRFTGPHCVHIRGKGYKERTCPLWPETIKAIKGYLASRGANPGDHAPLFLNAQGVRLSRFGLRHIVAHRVQAAAATCSTLLTRKVGPHTFRHTTAMHLLQRGTDLNMIRSWLGHSSIETTNGYIEIDLDMKRKTLQACEGLLPKSDCRPSWQQDDVLAWLSRL
jgi:site-specific recombinase XerD